MDRNERNKKYNEYVNAKIPKTKIFPSILNAFWIGGLICVVGEGINDLLLSLFETLSLRDAWAATLIILIFIASFLTALGVWDKIGAIGGAGAIIPITGFSNSITSPAIEFKQEGIIFGMCVKMFSIAGPVIVNGIVAGFIVGLIYLIF
ncbi:MAG: SpoVA/SpoVAEb family sporulation membrane protein [Clostridia bacterium]